MRSILDVKPYNELWLDCVKNNLISLLLEKNSSYKDLIYYFEVTYHKKIINQVFDYDGVEQRLLEEGFFTPKVIYSLDALDDLFEKIEFSFNSEQYSFNELHNYIKKSLNSGYSLFLDVDRFYYLNGRESGKTNMIHPVFIYGYDDDEQNYYCIEDCIIPGTMEKYKLQYSCVEKSCNSFLHNGDEVKGFKCRVIRNLPNFTYSGEIKEKCIRMCHHLLDENKEDIAYNLRYMTGISGLKSFLGEYEKIITLMNEFSLYKMRILQFQQLHQRNLQIIHYLKDNQAITENDYTILVSVYNKLFTNWQLFKRISFNELARKKIYKSKYKLKNEHKQHLSEILREIIILEENASRNLLKALKKEVFI